MGKQDMVPQKGRSDVYPTASEIVNTILLSGKFGKAVERPSARRNKGATPAAPISLPPASGTVSQVLSSGKFGKQARAATTTCIFPGKVTARTSKLVPVLSAKLPTGRPVGPERLAAFFAKNPPKQLTRPAFPERPPPRSMARYWAFLAANLPARPQAVVLGKPSMVVTRPVPGTDKYWTLCPATRPRLRWRRLLRSGLPRTTHDWPLFWLRRHRQQAVYSTTACIILLCSTFVV